MADIKIIVDTTSLVEAKKRLTSFQNQMGKNNSILGLTRALNGVESNIKGLISAQKKGQLSSKSFNQGLLEQRKALEAMGLSSYKAKQRVEQLASTLRNQQAAKAAADATRDLARAQKEVADAHERTRQRYVAGAAAQAQLKKAQRDLSAAYRAGVINIDEYRQALILLNQQNLGNRRSTNNLGVAMQQTGYQVGDFVVQVQSGQNPMVAFGQQATQLVGVLYLLPPAVLASTRTIFGLSVSVSALVMSLGIAVPILTAIGAAYMRFKKESDKAGQATDKLAEKVDSLVQSLRDYDKEKLAQGLGISVDQLIAKEAVNEAKRNLDEAEANYRTYLDNLRALNPVKVFKSMLTTLNPMSDPSDFSTEEEAIVTARQRLVDVTARLADQQRKKAKDQTFALEQEIRLQQEIAVSGANSSQVKALALKQEIASQHRSLESQRTSLELAGQDVDVLKAQVEQVLRLEASNEVAAEQRDKDKEAQDKALATAKEIVDVRKEEYRAANKLINANENNLDLLRIEAEHTKDSVQYREELVTQEKERLRKLVLTTGYEQWHADLMLLQFKTLMGITEKMSDSADKAKDLADALKQASSAMASLSGFSDSLDKKLAVSVAKVQALKNGVDSAISGSIAGMRMDLDKKMSDAISSGADLGIVERMFGGERERISQYETSENERKRLEGENKGSSSRGASTKDPLAALKARIKLDQDLLGVSEARATVLRAIANSEREYTPEAIKGAVLKLEAYNKEKVALEEIAAQQKALAQTLASSMDTALTSMIDGTKSVKEAFKDMARDIVKHLFKVLVVQQMINNLGGIMSGSSNSFISSIGGGLESYGSMDGGGYTGDGSRSGGLDGKGGFMMMMHPKETVIDHTKPNSGSGGGDTYVTNNHYSISANTSEDTKRLVTQTIQQATPTITANTKASIMNDRRRGGQMKSVFG